MYRAVLLQYHDWHNGAALGLCLLVLRKGRSRSGVGRRRVRGQHVFGRRYLSPVDRRCILNFSPTPSRFLPPRAFVHPVCIVSAAGASPASLATRILPMSTRSQVEDNLPSPASLASRMEESGAPLGRKRSSPSLCAATIVVSTSNGSLGLTLTSAVANGAALLEDYAAFAYRQVMTNRVAGEVPSLFPS